MGSNLFRICGCLMFFQVIEKLFRLRWSRLDGVGAIIISPTRELAVQIFDELKKVGKHHSLSGGLLIGGRKGVEMEKGHVSSLNILVCTPGRLLQHMDETPNFDCSQLQVSDCVFALLVACQLCPCSKAYRLYGWLVVCHKAGFGVG